MSEDGGYKITGSQGQVERRYSLEAEPGRYEIMGSDANFIMWKASVLENGIENTTDSQG